MPKSINYTVGIDLGGSSVKAIAISESELLAQTNVAFDAGRTLDWLEKARGIVGQFQERFGAANNIGVSAPGLAAKDGTSIVCMPGRLKGLEGLNWAAAFGRSRAVPVLNDAHAAILGEAWRGAAKGYRDVFMLTLGTGVGGAAIVDGQLLRGSTGRGGHLGHASLDIDGPPDVTGMPGSLEMEIGNCTIMARSEGRFATTHELIAAFEKGDPFASKVWLRSVKALACALGSFINILDPEALIIGGGIAQAGDSLLHPLQVYLDQVEWRPTGQPVKVLTAQLGELAGAFGAAWSVLETQKDYLWDANRS